MSCYVHAVLDAKACYQALKAKDPRFDGRLFVGVTSTGIYCRPICPAPSARLENCRFFRSAAAAQEAGFRPCLRCRPELVADLGSWKGTSNTVSRALALIAAGQLDDEEGVEAFAERLGVGGRQLRRLFDQHLGASPVAVAQTRRVLFAKQLLHETRLPMTEVWQAAGFGSVRRFNELFLQLFKRPPSALRRGVPQQASPTGVTVRLRYRAPYDWEAMLAFLRARAVDGVERVSAHSYFRTVLHEGEVGSIEVTQPSLDFARDERRRNPRDERRMDPRDERRMDPRDERRMDRSSRAESRDEFGIRERRNGPSTPLGVNGSSTNPSGGIGYLAVTVDFPRVRSLAALVARVRRLFDLDADVKSINAHLARDPLLRPLVRARPGLRTPGAWDGFELAMRAILGQQVTVEAGRRLASKLVEACGPRVPAGRLFPGPAEVAHADLSSLGMPRARKAALVSVANAALREPTLFEPLATVEQTVARLRAIPGLGDWTAQYIALRAAREPDAFPSTDVGLLRGAAKKNGARPTPTQLLTRAEAWRPWRAYAAQHLWTGDTP